MHVHQITVNNYVIGSGEIKEKDIREQVHRAITTKSKRNKRNSKNSIHINMEDFLKNIPKTDV